MPHPLTAAPQCLAAVCAGTRQPLRCCWHNWRDLRRSRAGNERETTRWHERGDLLLSRGGHGRGFGLDSRAGGLAPRYWCTAGDERESGIATPLSSFWSEGTTYSASICSRICHDLIRSVFDLQAQQCREDGLSLARPFFAQTTPTATRRRLLRVVHGVVLRMSLSSTITSIGEFREEPWVVLKEVRRVAWRPTQPGDRKQACNGIIS